MMPAKLRKANDVLIVEDDDAIRHLLVTTMGREGLSCDAACDGVEGLALLEATAYTVMLLDGMMPRMGGLELLQRMEAWDLPVSEQPIVFLMTAVPDRDPIVPVAESIHAIFQKPFDIQELVEIVCACVTARRQREGSSSRRSQWLNKSTS